jgi:hypothetical protein
VIEGLLRKPAVKSSNLFGSTAASEVTAMEQHVALGKLGRVRWKV